VRVQVAGVTGGTVLLTAGTPEGAQGRFGNGSSLKIRDQLTLPLGSGHSLVAGIQGEFFDVERGGVNGAYGVWTFPDLDAFEAGVADRFELRKDFGSAGTPLSGNQFAAWAGDEWRLSHRVSLTLGLRADRLDVKGQGTYNPEIEEIFGRRTDQMPPPRLHLSPRVGVAVDLSRSGQNRLRAGIGLFTGRPPLAWYVPALSNHGEGIGALSCGFLPTDDGLPPLFEPDYQAQPDQCIGGPPLAAHPFGDVDLLAPDLRMAQSLRGSLALDLALPAELRGSAELLWTREVSGFAWANLNLRGPQATDRHGRVMYGTIGTSGIPSPALKSSYAGVIELRNTSKN
jgi:hypothetical protein